jgi:hypothetical protein
MYEPSGRTRSPKARIGGSSGRRKLLTDFMRQRDLDSVQGSVSGLPQVVVRIEVSRLSHSVVDVTSSPRRLSSRAWRSSGSWPA